MPSKNTYQIVPNQSLIVADGHLTVGLVGSPTNQDVNININGKQQSVASGDVIEVAPSTRRRCVTCGYSPSICSRRSRTCARRSRCPWQAGYSQIRTLGSERIDLPQRRVADAGKAAEQTEIELPFAAVPAVIAGSLPRSAAPPSAAAPPASRKIAAAERVAGLAEKFDAAERAAAQRIDVDRASRASRPRPRCRCRLPAALASIAPRLARGERAQGRCRARRGTTGTARPARAAAQIRPVVARRRRSWNLRTRCIPTRLARTLRVPSPPPTTQAHRQSRRRRATCR